MTRQQLIQEAIKRGISYHRINKQKLKLLIEKWNKRLLDYQRLNK